MRALAIALRGFAFALIAAIALAHYYSTPLRESLAGSPWLASLVPDDATTLALWLLVAALNAGAAFYLAALLDS